MNRREAALALSAIGVTALPRTAHAADKPARIGYLGPSAETAAHLVKAFQEGLGALGYREGHNIVVDYRWTNSGTRMNDESALLASAMDLVALKVVVLAVSIDPAAFAARKATSSIPIVMMNVSDPVELGLVSSLARPGGNITGMSRLSPELIGKSLEVLLETAPGAQRIGFLVSATSSIKPVLTENARQAARSRGLSLQVVELGASADLESAFAALKRAKTEALLVTAGGLFFTQRRRLADLATAQRLPAMFANTENVEAGGLMSYSPSSVDNYRRAAAFVDKILRGAKAGDIPVEQPTRFELAINMKTAKALGVIVPQSLLLRADHLIEDR
jgi:putative ABC transport system substrate-binding protein